MSRLKHFQREVNELQTKMLRDKMPEGRKIDASFCVDLPNSLFTFSWLNFKINSGSIPLAAWIKNAELVKCKKSEATCLLMVGEKSEAGYFIIGKHKNVWLKPLNS